MRKSMFIDFDNQKGSLRCAEEIKDAGFSEVFLWWGREREQRLGQVRICEKLGLAIETGHTSFAGINNMWLDNPQGAELTDYFLNSISDASDCGVPILIVHLSSGNTPPPMNSLGLDRFARICDFAAGKNIKIAFENLRKVEYLKFVTESINSPALGFCFDCGHENIYNGSKDVLERFSPLLCALHLHDNFGKADDHLLPFEGTIDWHNLTSRLKKTGKQPPITIEVMKEGSDPGFARRAFEAAGRIETLLKTND